jgi:hypothetical protein
MTPYYDDNRGIQIYHGDYQEILPQLGAVDHIITDPPYSERTHTMHNAASVNNADGAHRQQLHYGHLTPDDVKTYVELTAAYCTGWIVTMTDSVLAPIITKNFEDRDRYVFAPLPFVAPGSRLLVDHLDCGVPHGRAVKVGHTPGCLHCRSRVARPVVHGR